MLKGTKSGTILVSEQVDLDKKVPQGNRFCVLLGEWVNLEFFYCKL